jgi:hypothetical protein
VSAHVSIEETDGGWLVRGDGLDGKLFEVHTSDGGVTVDIAADDQPLPVSLEAPQPK